MYFLRQSNAESRDCGGVGGNEGAWRPGPIASASSTGLGWVLSQSFCHMLRLGPATECPMKLQTGRLCSLCFLALGLGALETISL